jgi:nucleotide-binding universal stress UspA family protein
MISKIVVAFNDSPEALRALRAGIELARACKGELATASIPSDVTDDISFAIVVDPEDPNVVREVQRRALGELHKKGVIIGEGAWSSDDRFSRRRQRNTGDTPLSKKAPCRSSPDWVSSARLLFAPTAEFDL